MQAPLRILSCILLAFLSLITSESSAQLTVSSAPTPTQLVQNILLGPGVNASNITYSGSAGAKGSFNCSGACNVGISSGVLITSGSVSMAVGPNLSTGAGAASGTGSDPDLNALNPNNGSGQDKCVLEFDFTVATDSVRFRYVFGSEEYSDFVNTGCNDAFGFFINGPAITGTKNIALIPGTNTPITINNVNNGQAPALQTPTGPCTNCAYFRDNHGSSTVQYDGMTTVLTAASQVCPCETYHIKLAVQDFCDPNYDSGVFLEANSFQSVGEIPLMIAGNQVVQLGDTIYICPGDSIQLSINACRAPLWSTGDTTSSIWVTQPGIYYVGLANPPLCFAYSSLLYIQSTLPATVISPGGPTAFCPGDSVTLTATTGLSYLWSNGATTQSITVQNPGNYFCTVNFGGGSNCQSQSDTVTVSHLNGLTLQISPTGPVQICQGSSVTLSASAPDVLWSTGATTQSITVNSAGTYSATPTAQGFCPSPTSVNVNVNALPVVSINGNAVICQGSSTQLSTNNPFNQYSWSNGQTTAGISAGTAGTYTVTVTDANGCTGTNSFTVNVVSNPTPSISGNFAFCQGNNSIISSASSFTGYQWSNGATTPSININSAGNYVLTVTDANGCTGTSSQIITVYPLPIASITGVTAICQGANANLIANPPGISFLWSNGSTASTIQPSTAGTFTLTVTDGNGCTGSISQVVTVNSNPAPAISGNLNVCQGNPAVLSATSGFSNYTWSNGATTAAINVQSSGVYSVLVSDQNGCTGTASVNFNLLPFTQPVINGPVSFCSGDQANLSVTPSYASYSWNNGSSNQTLNVSTGGSYQVTATALNGCSGTATFNITMNPLPQPLLNANYDLCEGNSTNLQPGNFSSYLWSDGSTTSQLLVTATGIYAVTVSNQFGCTSSTSANVNIHVNPAPVISGDNEICDGETSALDAGQGYAGYQWSSGSANAVYNAVSAGTFTVTVSDNYGCTGIASFNLTVRPLPLAGITGTQDICEGQTSRFETQAGQGTYLWSDGSTDNFIIAGISGNYTVIVTNSYGCTQTSARVLNVHPNPIVSYTPIQEIRCDEIRVEFANQSICEPGSAYNWSFGDGSTSYESSPSHVYTAPGDYMSLLVITSPYGCNSSDSMPVSVIVPPLPDASFSQSARVVSIFNSEVSFFNQSVNATRYKWNFGDGESSVEENPVHIFDKPGTQKINLIAYNGVGCMDEFETELEVAPFYIPKAFTPNADGKNDYFFDGTPVLKVNKYRMIIFDRWGKIIYETENFFRPWDGTFADGTDCPIGNYTYRINITSLKGKDYEFTGDFSLIR